MFHLVHGIAAWETWKNFTQSLYLPVITFKYENFNEKIKVTFCTTIGEYMHKARHGCMQFLMWS